MFVFKLALGAGAAVASGASCTAVSIGPMDASVEDRRSIDASTPDASSECAAGEQRCSGACVDVATDNSNCGACDQACAASQRCVAGACQATMTCAAPEQDCGGGCVDTMTDTEHCGACGNRCMAGQRCANGACAASRCPLGQRDCAPRAAMPMCVDVRSDPMHCGVCGNACSAGETCASGVCQPSACASGTRCVVDGVASCRNVNVDRAHCGMCNRACAAGELCAEGRCQASCASSTACMVGGARVCVDTRSDEAHCGACGTACAAGEVCTAGLCGCGAGRTLCRGTCVDLQTDEAHCGACGVACSGGQTCTAGRCGCPAGLMNCNGACVDVQSNAAHCGRCGNACGALSACSMGTCDTRCAFGSTLCGGTCVTLLSLQSDENNCGRCGTVCPGASQCRSGACGPANDERADAQLIQLNAAAERTTTGTTVNATHDGPSVPCSCTNGANVWFRFRVPTAGVVYFDTAGSSFDTSLFLTNEAGTAVPAQAANGFYSVGLCNDDSRCGAGGGFTNENQARLAGYLSPGMYNLAVGGCGAGTFTLRWQYVSEAAGRNFVGNRLLASGTAAPVTLGSNPSLSASTCGGTAGAEYVRWYLSCGAMSERQLFSVCRSDGAAEFVRLNPLEGVAHDPVLYARSAQTGATLSCVDNSSASATVDCRGTIDHPAPVADQLDSSHYGARLPNLNTPRGIGTVFVDTKAGGPGMTFSLYSQVN